MSRIIQWFSENIWILYAVGIFWQLSLFGLFVYLVVHFARKYW